MAGIQVQRLGMIMEPRPGDPLEAEGVMNPAVARGHDGQLYLFPRMVAEGNYSRIGVARVVFNEAGDPVGVERLGIALEPETDYELRPGGGGCEDPRVAFVEPLQRYVMTYTAFSPKGPRVALAVSDDLLHWRRLGLASFSPYRGVEFDGVDNKDASVFPAAVPDPYGRPAIALLHRPLFPGTRPEETRAHPRRRAMDLHRESIWISYCPVATADMKAHRLGQFSSHHRLASPAAPWERLKIGVGGPPKMSRHGWLAMYHGVHDAPDADGRGSHLVYSAGVLVLSEAYPRYIRHRSPSPVLTPQLPMESHGVVSNVVFPTGVDRRDDLGLPDRFDIYYGMADNRIGVARLDMPDFLPPGAVADPSGGVI